MLGRRRRDLVAQVGGQRVADEQVDVLDVLHRVRRHDDGDLRELLELPAAHAGEADGPQAHGLGQLHRPEDVGGVAGAADADGDVAGLREPPELLREHLRVLAVVGPGGEALDGVDQGDALEPPLVALDGGLADVDDEVGGGGGAPAVAEEVDRPTAVPGLDQHRDDPGDALGQVPVRERVLGLLDVPTNVGPDLHARQCRTATICVPSGLIPTGTYWRPGRADAISPLRSGGWTNRRKPPPPAPVSLPPYAPAAFAAS